MASLHPWVHFMYTSSCPPILHNRSGCGTPVVTICEEGIRMATSILIGTVAYVVFSGSFLIALLRSAARTSDDWTRAHARPTERWPKPTATQVAGVGT